MHLRLSVVPICIQFSPQKDTELGIFLPESTSNSFNVIFHPAYCIAADENWQTRLKSSWYFGTVIWKSVLSSLFYIFKREYDWIKWHLSIRTFWKSSGEKFLLDEAQLKYQECVYVIKSYMRSYQLYNKKLTKLHVYWARRLFEIV